MIINFENIEEKRLPQFKGGEKEACTRMYTDENNKIAKFVLEPGASIGMHTHETNSEIVYILEGKGKALYDDGEEAVSAGSCHYCPQGHAHSMVNNSDENLVFLAVVAEHEK